MTRFAVIPLWAIAVIFAGLSQCVVSGLIEEHYVKHIEPIGWSITGVGILIITACISLATFLAGIGALFGGFEKEEDK